MKAYFTSHKFWLLGCMIVLTCHSVCSQQETFTNPVLPSGADPYSTYYNGYYYYTHSLGDKLVLWKTANLADLSKAETKLIWSPPRGTAWSAEIWAPEFHIIDKKWYVYFAADDGDNKNHRMYVLENTSEDPFQGSWEFKGKISANPDRWAIDGNVFVYKGQRYMIWSGWEGLENGQQNLYIARMDNPWTISTNRVLISEPTHTWERQGDLDDAGNPPHVAVNEGPQFLSNGGKAFIVFSANGCWTDYYNLGLLELTGEDPMSPQDWTKHPLPVFTKNEELGVYGPGHNSFFKSPDGTEDWILYHANDQPGDGCGDKRSPRMHRISWNRDGTPDLGEPAPRGKELAIPSQGK